MTEEIRIIIEALQEAFGAAWEFGESIYPIIVREFVLHRVFETLVGGTIGIAIIVFVAALFTGIAHEGISKSVRNLIIGGSVAVILAITFGVLQPIFAPNYTFFLALLR